MSPAAASTGAARRRRAADADSRYPRDLRGYGRADARSPLARRRPCRRAVRAELRGGRREQHPPRRCRLRGLPVGDRRRAALARPAPHEHGVDLRIRRPRRLLAAASPVHRAQGAGHGLWRGHGADALARAGGGDEGGRTGRSPATASNGSSTRISPRTTSASICARRSASTRKSTGDRGRSAGTPAAAR